jgi:hypothetical protein
MSLLFEHAQHLSISDYGAFLQDHMVSDKGVGLERMRLRKETGMEGVQPLS